MSRAEEKFTRKRLRSSYASVVVSISLVLFVLGIFGMLSLNAEGIARQVRENFAVNILLENEASPVAVRQFQKSLTLDEHVKSTEYISKEEAAKSLQEELDEDFMDFLGYNPLTNSIEVHLHAEYLTEEQLKSLEESYLKNDFVKDVVYDKPLIQKMNENISKISYILIGGAVLLTLIAVALINSSIRLAIYSRRFLIKTMQLVGATKSFIRQPFIKRSLWHGVLGAFVACILLGLLIAYLYQNLPGFADAQSILNLIVLGIAIFAAGILISLSCTFFAMSKYLRLKTDQLYF